MTKRRIAVRSRFSYALPWLASALVAGCHPNLAPLHPIAAPRPEMLCDAAACTDSVVLTYLGVSGFIIRAGNSAVMTAPSFTHQNVLLVALPFIPVHPDTEIVNWTLARERLDDISAILVGHAHYDHLLDVPYVATSLTPHATIYGSPTAINTLAPVAALHDRLHAITANDVASASAAGRWITVPGGRMRFMALHSSHAPNFVIPHLLSYTYANDVETEPRTSLPRTTHGWHLGEVYAYLIDVLDPATSAPVFRIFYQDAAAEPEYSSLPPLAAADRRGVDLAIICAGNFGNAKDYPAALLSTLTPRRVIVSHWEDFFRTLFPPFKGIQLTDTQLLADELDASVYGRWVTPEPLARMVYRY